MIKFILSFTLLFAGSLPAQEIVTDRPDQTESAEVVPLNSIQIETGLSFEETKTEPVVFSSITSSTLVRFGLLNNLELRAGMEYSSNKIRNDVSNAEVSSKGLLPFFIGTKVIITKSKGSAPGTALLLHITFPNESDVDDTDDFGTSFRFAAAHDLTDGIGLSYNLGAEWDGNSSRPSGIYTLSLGSSITDKLGGFLEIFGSGTRGDKPQHMIDGGLTYLFANNFQIDVSGGVGLTDNTPDYFVGGGIAVRLPR